MIRPVRLKEILQGEWLGHPLHPALVHLPTGLWPAALVFDFVSRAGDGNNVAVRTSMYCIVLGLAAALLAVPTGIADWTGIKREKPAWKLGLIHMGINAIVFVLFIINASLRLKRGLDVRSVTTSQLALSIAAVALLFISGYLGGRMVFDHGISVARQSKKKW